jgi:hypothetical protein
MDPITVIRAEAQRFADVLAATAPDARCPTCPDWSASDLRWHLTEVHYFWAEVLSRDVRDVADVGAIEESKPDRPIAAARQPRRRRSTLVLMAIGPDRRSRACPSARSPLRWRPVPSITQWTRCKAGRPTGRPIRPAPSSSLWPPTVIGVGWLRSANRPRGRARCGRRRDSRPRLSAEDRRPRAVGLDPWWRGARYG